jgi:TusE/DsrC/DsvC family sulfur relay protein
MPNNTIRTDNEGFMLHPEEWNEEIALSIAEDLGLEMNDERWEIVHIIREHYEDRQSVPEARTLLKELRDRHGKDIATRKYVYALFPYGYGQQACKIAGMRKPLKLMLDV